VRKPLEAGPSSTRRLAVALLCAFAGCLNPRPEEYPSDTASPGNAPADAPATGNPSRQGSDNFNDPGPSPDSDDSPGSEQPILPESRPDALAPEIPADAGADAGAADGGLSSVSE
jgi:hypothetical protein